MTALLNVKLTTDPYIRHLFDSPEVYPMTSPRGRVLIIHNDEFDAPANNDQDPLNDRLGSKGDLLRSKKIFAALDFVVTVRENLSSQEIMDSLNEEGRHPDHNKYGMFTLVMLSHGIEGFIYGSDARKVSINDITTRLSAKNFPSMADKPKLVIIQSCAGSAAGYYKDYRLPSDEPGSSQRVGRDGMVEADGPVFSCLPTTKSASHGARTYPSNGARTYPSRTAVAYSSRTFHTDSQSASSPRPRATYSTVADMLILLSSNPGSMSFRHTNSGSFMIQALAGTLEMSACHENIFELIVTVRNKVLKMCDEYRILPQAVYCNETLLKKLYLFPGMTRPDPGVVLEPWRSGQSEVPSPFVSTGSASWSESAPEATSGPDTLKRLNSVAMPTGHLPELVTPTSVEAMPTFPVPTPRNLCKTTPVPATRLRLNKPTPAMRSASKITLIPVPVARTSTRNRQINMPVPAPRAANETTLSIPEYVPGIATRESGSLTEDISVATTNINSLTSQTDPRETSRTPEPTTSFSQYCAACADNINNNLPEAWCRNQKIIYARTIVNSMEYGLEYYFQPGYNASELSHCFNIHSSMKYFGSSTDSEF